MRHRTISTALVAAVLLAASLAPSIAAAQEADPNHVVILRGVGVLMDASEAPIPPPAMCYETDLYNAKTDLIIGTGIDCLENITPFGLSIGLDRTTIFSFPQGDLWAAGPTSVVPVTLGTSPGFTHIVGDIPAVGTNSIVLGTGRFAGQSGSVRLSGAVDLSAFPGQTGFNCIFVIDLD